MARFPTVLIVRPATQQVVVPRYQAGPRVLVQRHNRYAEGRRRVRASGEGWRVFASPARVQIWVIGAPGSPIWRAVVCCWVWSGEAGFASRRDCGSPPGGI